MTVGRVALNRGRALLPAQYEYLVGRPGARVRVAVGGWRSSKTFAAVLAFIAACFRNPWRETYGGLHPASMVVGLTRQVLHDSSQREMKKLLPPEAIRKVWNSPTDERWLLANGHEILWRSDSGEFQGGSLCNVLIDEAHLLESADRLRHWTTRATDADAAQTRVFVAGLPELVLREVYEPREAAGDQSVHVVHFDVRQNRYVLAANPGYVEEVSAGLTKEDAEVYLAGRWRNPEGSIYGGLLDLRPYPQGHIVQDSGRPGDVVRAIGLDFGETAAAVFLLDRKVTLKGGKQGDGILVAATLTLERKPARDLARAIKDTCASKGWKLDPSRTRLCIDPSAFVDVVQAVRDELPGIPIIQKDKADREYYVEYGIRCVRGVLSDSEGEKRMLLSSSLDRSPKSLIAGLQSYRRHPSSGKPLKCQNVEHNLDAIRYAVMEAMPQKKPAAPMTVVDRY